MNALARSMAAPSESTNDVEPVSSSVYQNHTVCFGLFFRKKRIERVYLNGQARLGKTMVYAGYATFVVILGGNLLYGWLRYKSLCSDFDPSLTVWKDLNESQHACFYILGLSHSPMRHLPLLIIMT